MNIYSSGGAYSSMSSRKNVRGRTKKIRKINVARAANKVSRTATSHHGTNLGMGNFSFQGLIRNAETQTLTTVSGGSPYDATGLHASSGSAHMFITATCGTDFTDSTAAFAGKNNIRITFSYAGVEYRGFLGETSSSSRTYKIDFPTIRALLSGTNSTGLDIEWTD
jgi:hypothetical protein